jgi:hypothetical protein
MHHIAKYRNVNRVIEMVTMDKSMSKTNSLHLRCSYLLTRKSIKNLSKSEQGQT